MPYMEFPNTRQGKEQKKAFWLSEDGLILIRGWRRRGVTLGDIAEKYIGVSKSTFFGSWYKNSDELRQACSVALDIANMSVEEALLKKATGFYYWEESWELVEGRMVLTKKYKKYSPPDTKAILSWLYNRLPEQWRSVQDPLESTKLIGQVESIMVAMRQVAENGEKVTVEKEVDNNELS